MYKSKAQQRFFHTASARKKGITPQMVEEFDSASKGMMMPEKKMPPKKRMMSKESSFKKYVKGKYPR